MEYIALDAHKHYSLVSVERAVGGVVCETRLEHRRGKIERFLARWDPGSPVAVETTGNWYWLVDEIEAAGMTPRLVHARKAKLMSGMINKTDKLDVRGLNRLQRTGTLPTVWIPPAELRDQRDLPRTRMVLARERTRFKNRIHAAFAKYAAPVPDVSDVFGVSCRKMLNRSLALLPPNTRFATDRMLEQLDRVEEQITQFEQRMHEVFKKTPELELLMSLPGIGPILGTVILLEVGDVHRFPDAEHLAGYAGTTPRVGASAGKVRYGRLRPDVNHYLKWAYLEAANVVCLNQHRWPTRHAVQLYQRVKRRRNHQKAIGAVGRHLAEATYWILTKEVPYREPHQKSDRVHEGVSAASP
jgi:transposase